MNKQQAEAEAKRLQDRLSRPIRNERTKRNLERRLKDITKLIKSLAGAILLAISLTSCDPAGDPILDPTEVCQDCEVRWWTTPTDGIDIQITADTTVCPPFDPRYYDHFQYGPDTAWVTETGWAVYDRRPGEGDPGTFPITVKIINGNSYLGRYYLVCKNL